MRRIALRIKYRGTNYHGWQRQERDITVQEVLEDALAITCEEPIRTIGCGRTDAGVHARRYCVSFDTHTKIPLDRLPLALNTRLPDDIAVEAAVEAPPDFNAILSCVKKEYTYRIYNSRIRDPFFAQTSYFHPGALDHEIMARGAEAFVGTHDFAAVRSVGTQTKTTIRTVHHFEVERIGEMIVLRVCADGFLYNMARAMVGTLLYVSQGKIAPEDIPALLATRDRRLTGPTAPPEGLAMSRIWYDGVVGQMMSCETPTKCDILLE
ncbi:MAG: tRNA pseudouridine(38-40) synthase TruA [Oscillospiraceae bacterium]|nr:tRNA pseudouridine(38-40) synthase TruA [Oscillospiraceae bacterium]